MAKFINPITGISNDVVRKAGADAAIIISTIGRVLEYTEADDISSDGFLDMHIEVFHENYNLSKEDIQAALLKAQNAKVIDEFTFVGSRLFIKVQ